MVEDAAGGREVREALLFFTEFAGMGDQAATGAARGMLDVKHLVEENVLDGQPRHSRPIHAAIEQDLVRAGIIAAELAAPTSFTPADMGALELALKIADVQLVEHLLQVE